MLQSFTYTIPVYSNEIRIPKLSMRGELEISDVSNHYIKRGAIRYAILKEIWTDAGTPGSYRLVNECVIQEGRN